jgi:hypothetical protein
MFVIHLQKMNGGKSSEAAENRSKKALFVQKGKNSCKDGSQNFVKFHPKQVVTSFSTLFCSPQHQKT